MIAALYRLQRRGELDAETVAQAIEDLGIDPEKVDSADGVTEPEGT